MYVSKIRLCGSSTGFNGIQATVKDEKRLMNMKQIGKMSGTCTTVNVPVDGFISEIKFTYDAAGINHFKITDSNGSSKEKGQPKRNDE